MVNQNSNIIIVQPPYPSPSTILSASSISRNQDKLEMGGGGGKFANKDSFDFEIVEQLINEQQEFSEDVQATQEHSSMNSTTPTSQQSQVSNDTHVMQHSLNEQEAISGSTIDDNLPEQGSTTSSATNNRMPDSNMKYRDAASSIKRFDPKFRALTEAFRLKNEEDAKAAAIAAETNSDTTSGIDDSSARSTQDHGIMAQAASQPDSMNDQDEQEEEKFYKYMSSNVSSLPTHQESQQERATGNIGSQQIHPPTIEQAPNTTTGIAGMASPSTNMMSPIGNNDRYQSYQGNRVVYQDNIHEQQNQQIVIQQQQQEAAAASRSTAAAKQQRSSTELHRIAQRISTGAPLD